MALCSSDLDCGENNDIVVMATVRKDLHSVRDIDPGEPSNIISFVAFECTQAAPQSLCLNDVAFRNILFMLPTLDTSHREMSVLNDVAPLNM